MRAPPARRFARALAGFAPLACGLLLMFGAAASPEPAHPTALPPPPAPEAVAVLSLDDRAGGQRALALWLQNAGEATGRVAPLPLGDGERLALWLAVIDGLAPGSELAPALAALHFGAAARGPAARRLARALAALAQTRLPGRWPWLVHAAALAGDRGGDRALAAALARPLADLPAGDLPDWARRLPDALSRKEALR
ncbi:hypothetical protein F11_00565 [Rhodospirillum rubrum F11]|uniref:Secreted protein n=1 Tax=Rhodospirillum rubrum (strain ATCC 11170 / ATH 1.1.1 / DSM 467 / LMG 4362 / NCIMB 8255 / S1) TaxID=269796 RepID=Q2RY79_RHORT|nr:hypothetical protein [Rhodospirillum rubrum]ABC20916.1 hypothetical protein Rru_A0111 [Rhodospirillum rubrum ATCC 11170]AEO46584.1 hypothetical protein F11_00565 [Rhodospirillum rubrum F11]MBK5952475.1 hypothetical protein [Rhodospirillum rubrum]QXG80614.1 hypothetical protein KUL73_00565 [Rhodospirillum rubrum]